MISSKIVLITGASSGIGAACALHFARAGARLLLCARNITALEELATHLQQEYKAEIHLFTLDVRDRKSVVDTLAQLPAAWQNIDILVNNAGLAAGFDPAMNANLDDWEVMIDTNIKGLMYMTHEVLPGMVARNSGHIINIGSVAGRDVYPKGSVYCATKHAVRAFSQGLRLDLMGSKVRVSSVDPGMVHTQFSLVRFKGDVESSEAVYRGMTPLTADDVADAVLYCATRPLHANVHDILLMPTDQAGMTAVARGRE